MEEIGALAEKYKERNAAVTRERLRRFPNKKILGNRAAYQQMIEWRKEEVNKFGPSTKRQLVLILLPHQNRRLSQIVCRDQGLKILLMKEVQEHLEFTDDQKKQFESILAGFYRPGPGQPGLRLPPDEKDENDNRMRRECLAIMTADQKEKLKVNILGE
jgi:hypothetical protein